MAQDPRVLLAKADKQASSAGSGFSLFGGKAEKYEGAADAYTQAGNAFRLAKQGKEAGSAFEKAASIQKSQLSEPDDAANSLVEAFKVYRLESPEDAARVLTQAIAHYTSRGSFRRAATQQEQLAGLIETQIGDSKRAMEAYATAAEWYSSDNAEALANKLYLKVGDLAAEAGDYATAVQNFENVAKQSINNNLMRWSVKEYLLKAGICHLASTDMVATRRALEAYLELDPSFAQQREYKLLVNLAEAVEQGDQEAFSDHLFQYDQMSKLDKWKTKICKLMTL